MTFLTDRDIDAGVLVDVLRRRGFLDSEVVRPTDVRRGLAELVRTMDELPPWIEPEVRRAA